MPTCCERPRDCRVRYDKLLGRLEALASRRGNLVAATVPGGLLKALDDDADPHEWIQDCVLTPHRRENERARGLLHALGVRCMAVIPHSHAHICLPSS